ncbi:MAG: hypothetical protein L6R30_06505 [Thermoanaerobaculia bacterium]|nr:hypothetical protein [Thermoanaerobaculia bacterium]
MDHILGLALAAACLLFTLSLPFSGTAFAGTLRRWAGFLLLLAFGPSLFFGVLQQAVVSPGVSAGGGTSATDVLAGIGGFALLSLGAYVTLLVRSRLKGEKRDAMSDYFRQRSAGKRLVEREERDDHSPF